MCYFFSFLLHLRSFLLRYAKLCMCCVLKRMTTPRNFDRLNVWHEPVHIEYNWICTEMKRWQRVQINGREKENAKETERERTRERAKNSTAFQASQTEIHTKRRRNRTNKKKQQQSLYDISTPSHRTHIPIHLKAYDFATRK